jgi:ABC-type anion transport system duplicated permease subunit
LGGSPAISCSSAAAARFYFPLVTCIIISIVLSALFWLFWLFWLFNR